MCGTSHVLEILNPKHEMKLQIVKSQSGRVRGYGYPYLAFPKESYFLQGSDPVLRFSPISCFGFRASCLRAQRLLGLRRRFLGSLRKKGR